MLQVVSNSFVSPSAQSALNGEIGLTLHDVALSLGAEFKIVKRKLLERGMLERIKAQNFTAVPVVTSIDAGSYGEREIESFTLDVDAAKFFVAKYDNEIGDSYLAFLINQEKKVLSYEEVMANILANPRAAADILVKKAEKDEALAKLHKEKLVLESNFGKIAGRESGKALLQSENLQLKTSLGIAETYKSVKAALKIYPVLYSMNVSAVGKALTKLSKEMGREVKKIPDSQYETVNAYHVTVIQAYAASLAHVSEGA